MTLATLLLLAELSLTGATVRDHVPPPDRGRAAAVDEGRAVDGAHAGGVPACLTSWAFSPEPTRSTAAPPPARPPRLAGARR
jgi:hypothetical protein